MYQKDAEVLFPARVIPALRDLRGPHWQALVDKVVSQAEEHEYTLAFGLMMIRLDGCLTCHPDSYRAMRGCTVCAQQAIIRFKGSDEELVREWETALVEIERFRDTGQAPEV